MDAARHKRRNLIQNIVIACLTVSAVFLFAQLQLYNLDTTEDPHYLERLTGTLPDESPSQLREFPAPVRVVITDSYGRYGSHHQQQQLFRAGPAGGAGVPPEPRALLGG